MESNYLKAKKSVLWLGLSKLQKNYYYCLIIFMLYLPLPSFALEQQVKQWLGINAQQSYGEKNPWRTYLYSQLRFVDQSHPWQAILFEGALGYQLVTPASIWFGYRWTGRNPYNNFYQENRIFQQYIVRESYMKGRGIFRSRFEQITHGNASQVSLRFRQRFAFEVNYPWFKDTLPFFYDEIFFQLNHPSYEPSTFVSENRLFIGFNLYRSKRDWWEIGYINQYQFRSPQQTENQLNHIISVTYNLN